MNASRLLPRGTLPVILALLLTPALHAADGSLAFDGAGDYVEVPAFDTLGVTNEVTVEFWAKTNATAQQSAFMLSPDNGNNRFQAHISYFNGNTYWDCGDITTTGRLFMPNPAGTVGNWTHYAFVASQSAATGKMRIYVNGVQVATSNVMDPWDAASSVLRIGGSTSNFLNGSLDDFRVWNVARSETEVRQSMSGPLTGSETGLRLYFKFDEGSGAIAVNSATATGATFNGTVNGNPAWAAPARTTYTVANTSNSGAGSLRQALADAAAASGPALIDFAPALSGQTIALSAEIAVSDTRGIIVDASSLTAGITLSGGNATRLLFLNSGTIATFRAVTFTGGNGTGAFDSGRGGAIYSNNATLTLDRCTLHGNTAASATGDGGAIFVNFGTVALTNCTLTANSVGWRGGAIFNKGTLTLTHCTVAGNSAENSIGNTGEGGGIYNEFVACTLQNSIVSGNTVDSTFGTQILQNGGTLTSTGANLVVIDNAKDIHSGATVSGTFNNAAPDLAALAANGGPTQTMLPNAGSPAIDAAVGSTAATDQRGLSRPQGGTADIGAVETVPASGLVVQNTNDSGPGSLRQAIAEAALFSPGADTITFAPGLNGQTITLGSEVVIADTAALTVDASSLPGGLTLTDTGNVDHRLLSTSTATHLTLRGLTLAGGGGAFGGGGGSIYNQGNLTLTNCTISGSTAGGFGGAIFNSNPTQTAVLSLTSCTLANNSGLFGGAIFNDSSLTLTNCTLSSNAASNDGGGIHNGGGTVTLTQSTLSGNSASDDGGGIYNTGTVTLTQSTLSSNAASSDGGGISNFGGGTVTLTQSTLSDNSASFGGGIYNYGTLTLTQSTLSGNSASDDGGGIYHNDDTLTLIRSIVAANTAPNFTNIRGSFTGSYNLTDGDPLLAPLGNYGGPTQTRPPLPGSPALDAGGSTTDTTDQRGLARVVDADGNGTATVDIGAVELQVRLVTTTADENNGLGVGGVSLREAVADASGGSDIIRFHSSLNGQTLTLGGTHLSLARGPLLIDGSTLPGGITISGNSNGDATLDPGESRIFNIPAGVTVVLRRLNLINGADSGSSGGAIQNIGQLTVDQCSFYACLAIAGGAISNAGTLTVTQSTLSGNAASQGGGIFNIGTLTLTQSTLSGNAASQGGGIYNTGTLTLNRSIVAGNMAETDANIFSFGTISGTNSLIDVDPLLAPLGNYGGPTQTMPPLPGSPALDAGGSTTDTTDQRGAPRVADGDGNGSAEVDIGAVEAIPAIVTSTADSGVGSLRAALADPDPFITTVIFAPVLSGSTITLASEVIISDAAGVTIDASNLAGGLTIDGGPGTNRIFTVAAGSTAALKNLTLTGGDGAGTAPSGQGGAILNKGSLTLTGCTVSGNSAPSGFGGGIRNEATLAGIRSTISGNTSINEGGGIMNAGAAANLQLTHCTVTANEATTRGGGIRNASGAMSASFTIVAGNTRGGSLTHAEANLVGTLGGATNLVTNAPALAALGAYGGPTQTHALLATSPARNAATGSTATADQRGFPIVGTPDIGAYEAGTLNDFDAFSAETPGAALSPTGDADNDDRSDLLEYATQSDPNAPSSSEITPTTINQNAAGAVTQANVTFPTRVGATDLIYTLQRSTMLGAWTSVATWNATTGVLTPASGVSASRHSGTGVVSVTDTNVSGEDSAFYRLQVTKDAP